MKKSLGSGIYSNLVQSKRKTLTNLFLSSKAEKATGFFFKFQVDFINSFPVKGC